MRRSVFNERENLESLKSLHPVRFPFSILCNFSRCGNKLDPDIDSEESQKNHLPVFEISDNLEAMNSKEGSRVTETKRYCLNLSFRTSDRLFY